MADRRTQPQQQSSFAATAAFCLMTAVFVGPAIAASDKQIPCPDEVSAADLEVPVQALVSQLVNNEIPSPSSNILAPLAEAAIREAFKVQDSALDRSATDLANAAVTPPMAGTESGTAESRSDNDTGPVPDMNTRLPGVSDEALSRYRKVMYRRDI